MKRPRAFLWGAGCIVFALTAPRAEAQTVSELVARGISAYTDLDYDLAVELLSQALERVSPGTPDSVQSQIYGYLGAAEVFRGNLDSASSRFRAVLLRDPGYRLDQLVFPPEVVIQFDAVRQQIRAVRVVAPGVTRIRSPTDRFVARILATSAHRIMVDVRLGAGGQATTLYDGLVGDSVDVDWDVLGDVPPTSSRADVLRVNSLDAAGRVVRRVEIPLAIQVERPDTLLHPLPLDPSLFLPESTPPRPKTEALAAGLVAGLSILVLPQAFASETDLSPTRFAVSAGISLTGVIAFLKPAAGRPLPSNVAANAAIRQSWRDRVADIERQNERRRADLTITVRAGSPTVIDRPRP
jgi:hypothetical protein